MKRIKFISVPVKDQQRALEFWTKQVGFIVGTDRPMGKGQRWIELKVPGGQTGLVLFTPEGHEGRIGTFTGISFTCDDVEQTARELTARGVEFTQPPQKAPWGASAIFKDLEGNTFVLGEG